MREPCRVASRRVASRRVASRRVASRRFTPHRAASRNVVMWRLGLLPRFSLPSPCSPAFPPLPSLLSVPPTAPAPRPPSPPSEEDALSTRGGPGRASRCVSAAPRATLAGCAAQGDRTRRSPGLAWVGQSGWRCPSLPARPFACPTCPTCLPDLPNCRPAYLLAYSGTPEDVVADWGAWPFESPLSPARLLQGSR